MQNSSFSEEYFIRKTFHLAKQGMGWTSPNPMVGAVIVREGGIIGHGFHRRVGCPHAEIEALKSAKEDVTGATLYVNLEPCSHYGRTPPCVDAIIKSGIKRIVCSSLDPNPKVHGQGITKLKQAGIDVTVGILENEAQSLNEAFFTFHQKKRPFVAIKFSGSLDGKIATKTGDSKWITCEKARSFARNLRSQYQAILVGINTILRDDPHLGVLVIGKRDPLRIILDSTLKIPLQSQVLRDSNVIIGTTAKASKQKVKQLKGKGIDIIMFDDTTTPIKDLLSELRKREIISLLVEGGGSVLGSFVQSCLVDKLYAFHAPILIGGRSAVSAIEGEGIGLIKDAIRLKNITYKKLDDTFLTVGYLVYSSN